MLKYGMVGGGPDGLIGKVHRMAIDLDGKAELVAGCFSRNNEKTRQVGEKYGLAEDRMYADYEAMVKAEAARADGIDFAVVVTPNVSHYPICKAFLEAGVNVVCDKPLTLEIWQAEELVRLSHERDLLFCVTYTYSGHQTLKMARSMINEGEIGDIRMIIAEYPQGWLGEDIADNKQAQWRTDPAQTGKVNTLGDIGTHIENTVYQLTGLHASKVLARLEDKMGRGLDDTDMVLADYGGGISGMCWSTQVAAGLVNDLRVRVVGSKGTLEWSQEGCEQFKIYDQSGEIRTIRRGELYGAKVHSPFIRVPTGHNEGYIEAMANVYVAFTDALEAKLAGSLEPGSICYPTAEQGLEGVKFIHACWKSNADGNVWVEV